MSWKKSTRVKLSMTYHMQTEDQSEKTIQTFEDMLRTCTAVGILTYLLWSPPTNNSYHSSTSVESFKALYGWMCRTPLCLMEASGK